MKLELLPYVPADDNGRNAHYRHPRALDENGREFFKHQGKWWPVERFYLSRHGNLLRHDEIDRPQGFLARYLTARFGG